MNELGSGRLTLFSFARDGVPGEFQRYLRSVEDAACLKRNEELPHRRIDGFAAEGVALVARQLTDEVRHEKGAMKNAKGRVPKVRHEVRTWFYLLQAYCEKWNEPIPRDLLHLTFEVAELAPGKPALEVIEKLGLPKGVDGDLIPVFLYAAVLDGESDAAGEAMTVSALARAADEKLELTTPRAFKEPMETEDNNPPKVSRSTIRRWREMSEYIAHRRRAAWALSNSEAIYAARQRAVDGGSSHRPRADLEETFPSDVAKRLVAGEIPLKVFREYRGMDQIVLGQKAGYTSTFISQIEIGARVPSNRALRRLATALEVEAADLSFENHPG